MTTFKEHLIKTGVATNTLKGRLSGVSNFTQWREGEGLKINQINYDQLMSYVTDCKEKGNSIHTIRLKINSLRHYFDFLISENKSGLLSLSKQNPARLIEIKGGVKKIPQRLLTSEELIEIHNLQSTYGLAQKRNKVLLSLVVFQGVGSSDLGRIEVKDIDLMEGKIYIPAGRETNSRTLDLKPQQLLQFQDYLMNIRPLILKEASKQSDYFLVHLKPNNTPIMSNVISLLLYKLRPYYPKLKSLQQIRQSVITEWLKVHGLRQTQYMAGHRYVSSTERYNVDKMEGLKKELKSHYVLDK